MASVATRPSLIRSMFVPDRVSDTGVYSVRVYSPEAAKWRVVVVDDYLPVTATGKPQFARCRDLNEVCMYTHVHVHVHVCMCVCVFGCSYVSRTSVIPTLLTHPRPY